MKPMSIALGVAIAVLSCVTDAKSQTMGGQQGNTMPGQGYIGGVTSVPSQTRVRVGSRDDLMRSCRKEVFRRYGQRAGSQILMRRDNLIQMVDACVANGGTVN